MEIPVNKIKILLLISLGIILFQSIIGCAMLYTGIIYREFDKKNAEEMLEIIKYTDKNYYDKLMDNTDPSYLKEFQKIHTQSGNAVLKVSGVIVFFVSTMCMVPVIMMINIVFIGKKSKSKEKGEEKQEGKSEAKKEEEPEEEKEY